MKKNSHNRSKVSNTSISFAIGRVENCSQLDEKERNSNVLPENTKLVVNYEILVKYFIVILIAIFRDTIDGSHGKLISESVLC